MKREPTIYTLWVDGKAVRTFTRKPPKDVRDLVGSHGITITPPIEEEPKNRNNQDSSEAHKNRGGADNFVYPGEIGNDTRRITASRC